MSARVVAYSGCPEETTLRLMCECRDCGIEWGWTWDSPRGNALCGEMVIEHNREHHIRVDNSQGNAVGCT